MIAYNKNNKFHFNNLDSIRTLAFLSTFLAHAFYSESPIVISSDLFKSAIYLQEFFSFGVPVFFVLSGYLISYLMLREQELTSKFSILNFYIRRILRIWPVYYLVIFIGFVFFPFFRSLMLNEPFIESANPVMYILFLSNFDQIQTGNLPFGIGLGPTWSVSVEEQFYLVWPILLLLFPRRKFLWPIFFVVLSSVFLTSFFHLNNKHTIYCMMYLAVGSLFAYFSFYYNSYVMKIISIPSSFFVLILFIFFILLYVSIFHFHSFFMFVLLAFIIGYIIIFQSYTTKFEFRKFKILESLGKYTYGLYLYHTIFNFIVFSFFSRILKIEDNEIIVVFIRPTLSLLLSIFLVIFLIITLKLIF